MGFGAHLELAGLETRNQAREVLKSNSAIQRIIWTPPPVLEYMGLETSLWFGAREDSSVYEPGPPHLCLQGTSALSQGGLDGGHQLQKLALRVHVAITSLGRERSGKG